MQEQDPAGLSRMMLPGSPKARFTFSAGLNDAAGISSSGVYAPALGITRSDSTVILPGLAEYTAKNRAWNGDARTEANSHRLNRIAERLRRHAQELSDQRENDRENKTDPASDTSGL